jgi:hypothetical protein
VGWDLDGHTAHTPYNYCKARMLHVTEYEYNIAGVCLPSTYFYELTWSDHLSRYSWLTRDFASRII